MIIFNIQAAILGAIIAIIIYLISFIYPEITSIKGTPFWLICFVTASLGEFIKIKAKLFWLPAWLITFLGLAISSYFDIQDDIFPTFLILGLIFSALPIYLAKSNFQKKWNNAQKSLEILKSKEITEFDSKEYYTLLLDALFISEFADENNVHEHIMFQLFIKTWLKNKNVQNHYFDFLNYLSLNIPKEDFDKKFKLFQHYLSIINAKETVYFNDYMFMEMAVYFKDWIWFKNPTNKTTIKEENLKFRTVE
ncbi:hypothetical protein [Aureivirga sp. CE67]|uniref:hypothetical protein n=1 Tax=Aureivirga sp. CE67 TaxID=1788983 RepID=UPI0018CA61EE|nr:hypothetical protein [Aureivirga sp. CE67]